MARFAVLAIGFLLLSETTLAQREVRFWIGERRHDTVHEEIGRHRHLEFIRNALGPGTLLAGAGALDYYSIFIPPEVVPKGAALATLPFSEAALPSYESAEAYRDARARHPEYSPLHGKENGFDMAKSYSASPRPLNQGDIEDGVAIAAANPADRRVAYDLRSTTEEEPNWRAGTTLVWLQYRRQGVDVSDYQKSLARLFKACTEGALEKSVGVFGHFARVEKDFVLHFINVPEGEDVRLAKIAIKQVHRLHSDEVAIDGGVVESVKLEPFANGWDQAIDSGKAVNVQFPN